MAEIVEGLDGGNRDRIEALRKAGRFFWIDVPLSETSPDDLAQGLGIPKHPLQALLGVGKDRPSPRRFYADGKHVVFAFSCYLESTQIADGTGSHPLRPVEVNVLVCGDYLLTLHEDRGSLPELLAPYMPEGRSEQCVVYAVLEAMVASVFEALNDLELRLDRLAVLSTDLRAGRLRLTTLREISSRLSRMSRVGNQRGLYERIGLEVKRVEGLEADDERYFDRIGEEVNRLVDAIDAAANAMATLIDLRLNETSHWLTVVATIFLPLTFITGFFGMNFEWMVDQVDTQLAFWLLGIGTLVVGVALISRLIVRGSPIEADADTMGAAQRSRQT